MVTKERLEKTIESINHALQHMAHLSFDLRLIDRCEDIGLATVLQVAEQRLASSALTMISRRGELEDNLMTLKEEGE